MGNIIGVSSRKAEGHEKKRRKATCKVVENPSFELILRQANFQVLNYLKPQSVITLLAINSQVNRELSGKVLERYGKRLKPMVTDTLKAHGLSWHDYFLQELRRSQKNPHDYQVVVAAKFIKRNAEETEEFHSFHCTGPNHNLCLPFSEWEGKLVKVEETIITFTPTYDPQWLRDKGTAQVACLDCQTQIGDPFDLRWKDRIWINHDYSVLWKPDTKRLNLDERQFYLQAYIEPNDWIARGLDPDECELLYLDDTLFCDKDDASKVKKLFNLK